jgi:hypothetical protein
VVFVFGSNLAGRHGRGAAREAHRKWNAEYGVGEGLTGSAYAIPTVNGKMKPRSLDDIEDSYRRFVQMAKTKPLTIFMLTPFGTGLAGYSKREIQDIIRRVGLPKNVLPTGDWLIRQSR